MPEYILCPVCNNPALKDEPCAVCELKRRSKELEEATAAVFSAVAEETLSPAASGEPASSPASEEPAAPAASEESAASEEAYAPKFAPAFEPPVAEPAAYVPPQNVKQVAVPETPVSTPAAQYNALFEEKKTPDSKAYRRLLDKTYAPMSAWNVFGVLLLFAVPIIGFIFAVVFACGGCRKKQKASFARGYLLVLLFSLLFALILGAVFIWLVSAGILPLAPLPFLSGVPVFF
ncbi:MAG: hypothetical protein IKT43_02515 [Clostridia bacterium]|nr:hypothetical protein [Clostridia bacterium]